MRSGLALTEAIIATTDPEGCFDGAELGAWRQLRAASRLARLGCDAYAYAMVAAGTIDLVVEAGLKSWDVEAAVPVIAGAGGLVTDWRGAPIGRHGGQSGDRRRPRAAGRGAGGAENGGEVGRRSLGLPPR